MSYWSGLSFNQGTKPGFKKTSDKYGVCFEGVECDNINENVANDVKNKLETSYNWSLIIKIILDSLEFFHDASDFEDDLEDKIKDWFGSFQGWGLFSTLLPFEILQYLHIMYFHILTTLQEDEDIFSHNMAFWVEDNMWLRNPEDAYYRLKTLYESNLIPIVKVKLIKLVGGPKGQERRKMLLIKFIISSKFNLITKFTVDKKRLRRTLTEIAAEVVGQMVEDSEDLEIPETLKNVVSDKIGDADWVADYWLAKFKKTRHIDEEKSKRTSSGDDSIEKSFTNSVQDDDRQDNVQDAQDAASSGVLARVYNRVRNFLFSHRS
eukprot:GFUD01043927.1.p1 GENE.GFUD01043927.1~~GFUD01043927.1.p1  ORF type:complete len:321 (+),score=84.33 GFUD01043927.1:209-1171(+)